MTSNQAAEADNEEKLLARVDFINGLSETEAYNDSPINLDIQNSTATVLPPLDWFNYEFPPKKMKVTNTGHTVIVSAKWFDERPYLSNGPTQSYYVFNQMHFHWGAVDTDGSEHTVEGKSLPLEMHVVHFKSSYATQDVALREKDGMVVIIYFFELQPNINAPLNGVIEGLPYICAPHTSVQVSPFSLTDVLPTFANDYLVYWGCVNAVICKHRVMWLVCREKVGISPVQMEKFRLLMSTSGDPLPKHIRKINTVPRTVFHVNGGETPTDSTLLPAKDGPRMHISHPGPYNKRQHKQQSLASYTEPVTTETIPSSVPVYAMENTHIMPFRTEAQRVQSAELNMKTSHVELSKSVTFETDIKNLEEAESMKVTREALDEAHIAEQEISEWKDNEEKEAEKEARKLEQEMKEQRLREQEEKEEEEAKRERKAQMKREQEMMMNREQEMMAEREQDLQRIQLQEPLEVFHAATQKPSIGFKLRRPLVPTRRQLDMATQAPSMSDIYRPANALSTATVYNAAVDDDNEGVYVPNDASIYRSATSRTGSAYSRGANDGGVFVPNNASVYHATSPAGFAPLGHGADDDEKVLALNKTSTAIYHTSAGTSRTGFAVGHGSNNEGFAGREDFSALSCFDTKDFHMTPKASLAPTASIRKAHGEEREVYTTSFKDVGPLSSKKSNGAKK